MEPKKVYISGQISGLPIDTVANRFSKKAIELRAAGLDPKNPVFRIAHINVMRRRDGLEEWTDKTHRKQILGVCLFDLSQCEEIHMLPGWEQSQGARLEHRFAQETNIKIVYHIQ